MLKPKIVFKKNKLKQFYEKDYLRLNPSLGAEDVLFKVEAFQKILPDKLIRSRSVLEVGCGSKLLLRNLGLLLDPGIMIGADISFKILKSNEVKEVICVVCDAAALPFKDKSIDFVYSADMLEHAINPLKCLCEMSRVSNHVASLVPIESGLIADLHNRYRKLLKKPTLLEQYGHIQRFTKRDIFNLLNYAKLKQYKALTLRSYIFKAHTFLGKIYELVQRICSLFPDAVYVKLYGGIFLAVYCESG